MLELGMLDDDAFARAWVESRDRSRPRGERAMRQELAMKGIDRQIVDVVLGERAEASAVEDADGLVTTGDHVAAERLLERHRRALVREPDPRKRRQRAYGLLARNGFDPETCRTVAATVDHDADVGLDD
jgi:regulatory protein